MEIARNWRLQKQRSRLIGEKCPAGHFIFPPRPGAPCPECAPQSEQPTAFPIAISLLAEVLSAVDERGNHKG